MFKPRLTRPESGNPYYNRPPKGYAVGIIAGSPQDAGCDVLANCVGYAASRFNEILGQNCFVYFQYAPNPYDWIATAKTHGLQTGTEPKLGAVLVWEKHVCIVEKIHAGGSIITSESGYGCTPAFWTTRRNNSNGDWNGGGFGKFLGFIYQPENNETKEEYQMKKGIDISYCQTKVDWSKVTAEFVIARAGYGKLASQKDAMFESHYAGAKSKGIPIGAYWYSYAMDEASARAEADACIAVLKGKQFEYPIWYDVEDKTQTGLSQKTLTAIAEAFMKKLEAAGYWVGLYTFYSMASKFSVDVRSRYAFWLAHVNVKKSPYKYPYGMWQYSWVGKIAGINGDVDLDECYVDYPAQIKAKGLNGFTATPTAPVQPVMKSVGEIAHEVIDGKWGNGTYRKTKLTAAGYDYAAVQARVTELLTATKRKSVQEIAKEVLAGKWGNGAARKTRLTAAGYDYAEVQKAVNSLMK